MSGGERIIILLPTYNGAAYLAPQLDSLLAQTYANFIIVTRDDGSSDDTVEIVARYAKDNENRFHIVASDGVNVGAKSGFSLLLQYALEHKKLLGVDHAYMMFCDQDDIWKEEKISNSFAVMKKQEAVSPNTAILVHTDLEVVDENLRSIAPSFFAFQNLKPKRNSFWRLSIVNTVTGCTVMINENLARKSTPIPRGAIMHDWWLALVAILFGRIITLSQPGIYYRQHSSNTVGANKYEERNTKERIKGLLRDTSCEDMALQVYEQSRVVRENYGKDLALKNRFRLLMLRALSCRSRRIRTLALKVFSVF